MKPKPIKGKSPANKALNLLRLLLLMWLVIFNCGGQTIEAENKPSSLSAEKLQAEAKDLSKQWNGEALRRSISLFEQAAEIWKQSGAARESANCLREIASNESILGDYATAEAQIKRALILENTPELVDGKVKSLSMLAVIYLKSGKISESEKYSAEAVKLSESLDDPASRAAALFGAGQVFYFRRNINQSVESFRQSVNLWEKAGDAEGKANSLYELGYALMSKSEPLEGLKNAEQALSLFENLNDRRGTALSKIAVGHLNLMIGETQTALDSYKSAEAMFPADTDFYQRAILYNGIGTIYENYGELNLSLKYRQKAFELMKKEKHLFGQLATLPSLGSINYRLGNKEAALDYLNQGEKLAAKLNDNFYAAVIYEELGNIYFSENSNENALENFQRSLKLLTKIGYKKETEIISDSIGTIYRRMGRNDLAVKYYEDSLKISREIKNKFAVVNTLYNLASLNEETGKTSVALKQTEEILDTIQSLNNSINNGNLRKSYFSGVYQSYELRIKLLMRDAGRNSGVNSSIRALQTAESARARSMLENLSLAEVDLKKDAAPEIVRREKEIRILLNSKADKLTDLLSGGSDKSETEKLDGEINELEHELEEIKATLKRNSPVYSAIKNPAPFDVGAFQRDVLDENSLLLEFSFGKEESYLWLVGKTEINSYILSPRERIEARVEKLRELIAAREMKADESVEDFQKRIGEAENTYKVESRRLSDELFGQIADKLAGKRLIIVPDGKLHYFPIAALPFPNSADDAPFLLSNEIVYEPSAATLAVLMQSGKKTSAAPKNLLVFSDPIFSVRDARLANAESETPTENDSLKAENFRFAESLTSLARLDASKDEADAIVKIVGASGSTALSGAAATRERVLDASIADYKIVHFATHGLIKEDRPELSGIVLSQADENGQPLNGVVRLQDIYAMNLSADAVILSACSTGIGKEVRGEGLLSLNNAFLQSGARSVVASLWKVDDHAARELMKIFYREMAAGATTSEALRRAQIGLRQNPQYQSPFYWAAFTVHGDYKTAPQFAGSFDYRIIGALIIAFALSGIYFYRRKSNHSTAKL
jgi:CHAT domain-containing protein/tetratricopeptide (TPR) repeat protein